MNKETKVRLLSAAVAGLVAAGMTMAELAPAFAQENGDAGGTPAAAHAPKDKHSCKGSCKSGKDGCKGKHKHHDKKKHKKTDAGANAGATPPAGGAPAAPQGN